MTIEVKPLNAIVYNQDVDIKSFTVSANDKIEIKINCFLQFFLKKTWQFGGHLL